MYDAYVKIQDQFQIKRRRWCVLIGCILLSISHVHVAEQKSENCMFNGNLLLSYYQGMFDLSLLEKIAKSASFAFPGITPAQTRARASCHLSANCFLALMTSYFSAVFFSEGGPTVAQSSEFSALSAQCSKLNAHQCSISH